LCTFWEHEYHHNNDIRWTSIVWAQVLMDMVGPISNWKAEFCYTISMRQKSLQIMKKKEPNLFNRVKPFLKLEANNESK
jgi:hypothetical protein